MKLKWFGHIRRWLTQALVKKYLAKEAEENQEKLGGELLGTIMDKELKPQKMLPWALELLKGSPRGKED